MSRWDLPPLHVRAWYAYAFAAEVFSACALAIFLPITLEHIARDVGYLVPDLSTPCVFAPPPLEGDIKAVCKARIAGVWVDTASFSMYVKSIAVGIQALCIISIGPLADDAYFRKRILGAGAMVGSVSAILFLPLPSSPLLAAFLTIVGNASYAITIVCANAFLPGLAREDPEVISAARAADVLPERADANGDVNSEDEVARESRSLLPSSALPVVQAISAQDLAITPISPLAPPLAHYATVLSLTTSCISSTGIALGFFSGVSVLALLIIPVTLLHGSTWSLRLAIGLSGAWWAIFSVPAYLGLPGGPIAGTREPEGWITTGWKRVGRMVSPREIRRLPNLFTFLAAWIFLSDGFHTLTYTAILYASSTLGMSPSQVIIVGVLVQMAAVASSIVAPRIQSRLGYTNRKLLAAIVLLAMLIPIYACLGLLLPWGGLRTQGEIYAVGTYFGLLYGPFNSYARAVYAELIPPGHESTFFSLYSLTDKSSSLLGPLIVGLIADLTGNIRLGFIFLLIMLAVPIPVLLRVDPDAGREEASSWAKSAVGSGEEEGLLSAT